MNKRIDEFFKSKNGYDPRLEGVRGSYKFNVGPDSWFITVDNGNILKQEKKSSADCEIMCNEEDFFLISQGKQNLLTAAMQGRVVIKGDLALAQKLHGLTRSKLQNGGVSG